MQPAGVPVNSKGWKNSFQYLEKAASAIPAAGSFFPRVGIESESPLPELSHIGNPEFRWTEHFKS